MVAVTTPQPTLTDGVVVLRPWRDTDVDPARLGHDEEIARWFGFPVVVPSHHQQAEAVRQWDRDYADNRRRVNFLVEYDGRPAGTVEVRDKGEQVGELSWAVFTGMRGRGLATRAVRLLVGYAFAELGLLRVEAYVQPGNVASLRVAMRAGLRREGVLRDGRRVGERNADHVVLGRLAADSDPSTGESFRAMLNAALPRKRAIAQLLVRDDSDRVLLCQLTYKQDWDLPGGVVEMGEAPLSAAAREIDEELGLPLTPSRLLVVDWLPPWSGWDDAVCLVFDGGVHDASIAGRVVPEPREIVTAEFCTAAQTRARCRDFTARRIESALMAARTDAGAVYLESGAPDGFSGPVLSGGPGPR